ncbi:DNA polymerase III subunit delta [Thalassotalea agarivorans]|uniref:DNA polymerase III subunit delta n=1 Tax=Thalassotalea agarivorans TaxID=349064 RepID=A0A1I0I0J8_THASX|nr:DNA polymerase III subunit delta [Thalassotalea agarivorans]SET89042.1 DNA polymerase III, delta subunit [Thalassotalea agarivorans]
MARIYHNQLQQQLNKPLAPFWLIFGDEPWQKLDALNQIKQLAPIQGFEEVINFSADDGFDWQELRQEYQAMSLFAQRKVIVLSLHSSKLNEQASNHLIAISEDISPDIVLIIHGPRLDAQAQKRKWFKALSAEAIFLPVYDIDGKHLINWVNQRAHFHQLRLAGNVPQLLAQLFEGNLPSLDQELAKLAISYQGQTITQEIAESIVTKQAKFNPFQLTDTLLQGDVAKCADMLNSMKHEGVAAGQLIWTLHKECSQLYAMKAALQQGSDVNQVLSDHKVWKNKTALYQKALQSISMDNLNEVLKRIAQVDFTLKSASEFDPFVLLTDLCVALYHGETLQHYSLDYVAQ